MSIQQKERLCVMLARAHSRRIIIQNLASLDTEGKSFTFSYISEVWDGIPTAIARKPLLILALPIYLMILISRVILAPFNYLKQLYDLPKQHRILTNKLFELELDNNIEYPTEKSLNQLWALHGFKHIGDEELPLLNEWLDILFGLGTAARIDFKARQLKVAKGHNFVNAPYYRGDADAAHFSFPSSSNTALWIVSNELSYYG
jgi:hypothetical protein